MNCYIKFWDDGKVVTLEIDQTEKIKIDAFIEFATLDTFEQIPTENVIEIFFK